MAHCVSEGSYNILFILAVIVCLLMLGGMAYSYDKFKKASMNQLSEMEAGLSMNISLIGIILSILFILIFFILFFLFQKRLVGVYAPLKK